MPAGQATQPDPFEEKNPTGQKEHEFEEKHEEPAAQVTVQVLEQVLAAVAPDAVLNFPASHIVQAVDPADAAYVPAMQIKQSATSS